MELAGTSYTTIQAINGDSFDPIQFGLNVGVSGALAGFGGTAHGGRWDAIPMDSLNFDMRFVRPTPSRVERYNGGFLTIPGSSPNINGTNRRMTKFLTKELLEGLRSEGIQFTADLESGPISWFFTDIESEGGENEYY